MTFHQLPTSTTADPGRGNADWHVLALFTDDTENCLKGLWGPYSTFDIASLAMQELNLWPIDGYWEIRRLNKFVALKSVGAQDALSRVFTWQTANSNA